MTEKKILKPLDPEKLFLKLVKDYIDNRGYEQEQANNLAKTIVTREMARRNKVWP